VVRISDDYELVIADDQHNAGLVRLSGFSERLSLNGVPYKFCKSVGTFKSLCRREYCQCHEKNFISTPFARYEVDTIRTALELAKVLKVGSRVRIYVPTREYPLILLLPPHFLYGVFISPAKDDSEMAGHCDFRKV
jgi:hypothetical protein